jgi:tetratricopeptide (TPR) repeat protein
VRWNATSCSSTTRRSDTKAITSRPSRCREQALAEALDARLLNDYGYLLACHAQRELRRAVDLYEQAIELDPRYDKPHYQLLSVRASLRDSEVSVALCERRLAAAPGELREYRFLATACVLAHAYARAVVVADAGLELAPEHAQLIAARGEEGRPGRRRRSARRLAARARA